VYRKRVFAPYLKVVQNVVPDPVWIAIWN